MILWLLLLALQYDPNLHPKFAEATRMLQQQNFVAAVALLEPLTRDKPQVGEYWFALGIAHAASGNIPAALEPLRTACASQPRPPRSCYQYGRVLQLSNRFAESIDAFNAAGKNGEDATLFSAKAQSHEALGQLAEADQCYRAALAESALRPKNSAEIQYRYSEFLIRQKKFEASLWQLNQVLSKQPFFGPAWSGKGRVLMLLDRNADAADAIEQAIAHGERNRDNLLLLGRLYALLGDESKAEMYQKEAAPPQ